MTGKSQQFRRRKVSNSAVVFNNDGAQQGIRWITSIAPGPIGPSTRIRLVVSAHRLKFPTTENREICASEQRVRRANRGQCDVINSARRQIFESGNSDEYLERTGNDRLTRAVLWPIQMTEFTRISCRLSFGTLRDVRLDL
jgi:hypothetical protein